MKSAVVGPRRQLSPGSLIKTKKMSARPSSTDVAAGPYKASDKMEPGASSTLEFLSGGGTMGALIRAHRWEETALGPTQMWAAELALSPQHMSGGELPNRDLLGARSIHCSTTTTWSPILGLKHPRRLG